MTSTRLAHVHYVLTLGPGWRWSGLCYQLPTVSPEQSQLLISHIYMIVVSNTANLHVIWCPSCPEVRELRRMLALLQFPALIIVPSVLLFCILSIVHGDYEIRYSVDTTQPVHLPSNQRQGDHDLHINFLSAKWRRHSTVFESKVLLAPSIIHTYSAITIF